MKKYFIVFVIIIFFAFSAWNDYTWDKRYLEKVNDDWIIFDRQTNAIDPIYFWQIIKQPAHRLGLVQRSTILEPTKDIYQFNKRWVDRRWGGQVVIEDFLYFVDCKNNLDGYANDKTKPVSLSNIKWSSVTDNPYVTSEEGKAELLEKHKKMCEILRM